VVAAVVFAIFAIGAFALPSSQITRLMIVGFYAIAVSGMNVIVGRLGLITIGQAATVSIAAFVSLYLLDQGLDFTLAALLAMVVSAAVSVPLVLVSFRLDGLYFGIVTLVFLGVSQIVLFMIEPLSGGGRGVVAPPVTAFGTPVVTYTDMTLVIGVFVAVALGVAAYLGRSSTGLQWEAIRTDVHAAEALGLHPLRLRVVGYVAGSAIGALAGPVYVLAVGALTTNQFGLQMSLAFLVICVLGGRMNLVAGPLLGAAAWVAVPPLLEFAVGTERASEFSQLVFSVLIVGVLLLGARGAGARLPEGLKVLMQPRGGQT
jgi:branched-chain amino acid transport system permease protein